MLIPYTTVTRPARARLEIKRSVFLADLAPAKTSADAQDFLAARKKEFYDARHHCFALRLGAKNPFEKAGDDGEPQGTAGHPILRVLASRGLTDAVLVVTRYFGGIKLGAGGLTRAYTEAAALAADEAELVTMTPFLSIPLTFPYDALGALERYAEAEGAALTDRAFTDRVSVRLETPAEDRARHLSRMTDLTKGRLVVGEAVEIYKAIQN